MDTRPKIRIEASATIRRRTTFVTQPPAGQAVCRKCGAALEYTDKTICAACAPDELYPPAPACRKCGGHEDVNADGLCQQCLVECVNGAGILEDDPNDDLFATPRPRIDLPILHPITCAVCGLASRLPIGAPGDICGPCRTDLVQTRLYVETTLETARSRLHVLISSFEAAVARESEDDQARWANVVAARVKVQAGAVSVASFRARWRKALAAGDGLARILAAHEAYERGCGEVGAVERWAARASEELSLC
jgi:hypothetical protein